MDNKNELTTYNICNVSFVAGQKIPIVISLLPVKLADQADTYLQSKEANWKIGLRSQKAIGVGMGEHCRRWCYFFFLYWSYLFDNFFKNMPYSNFAKLVVQWFVTFAKSFIRHNFVSPSSRVPRHGESPSFRSWVTRVAASLDQSRQIRFLISK